MFRWISAAAILLWFAGCSMALSCEEPHELTMNDWKGDDSATLFVLPPSILDATVKVELTMDNLSSPVTSPFTFDLSHYVDRSKPFEVVTLHPTDPNKSYSFNYHFHYAVGNLGGQPDGTIYELPYARGETHFVSQGYRGSFTHLKGSNSEYALDFLMPLGTTVLAARTGIVIATRADSNEGGSSEKFTNCANYVIIRHSDGTYAEYVHLRHDGVLVRLGDSVAQGQPIGLSGQTGRAMAPHLHFAVFTRVDDQRRRTYPTQFHAQDGSVAELHQGYSY